MRWVRSALAAAAALGCLIIPAGARTLERPADEGTATGVPPGIIVSRAVCYDPGRAGDVVFTTRPLLATWDAASVAPAPLRAPVPRSLRQADLAVAPMAPCRFPVVEDGDIAYELVELRTGERTTGDIFAGEFETQLMDLPTGRYELRETFGGVAASSGPFRYDAETAPNLLMIIKGYGAAFDWNPPTSDPDNLTEINVIAAVCVGSVPGGTIWFDHTFGTTVGGKTTGQRGRLWSAGGHRGSTGTAGAEPGGDLLTCRLANDADVAFEVRPVLPGGDLGRPIALYHLPDGRFTTEWVAAGAYVVSELVSGTTVGALDAVGGHDVMFYGPDPATHLTG